MGVRSECGFCENNGPRSRGVAFFRGGVDTDTLMSSQYFYMAIFQFKTLGIFDKQAMIFADKHSDFMKRQVSRHPFIIIYSSVLALALYC